MLSAISKFCGNNVLHFSFRRTAQEQTARINNLFQSYAAGYRGWFGRREAWVESSENFMHKINKQSNSMLHQFYKKNIDIITW